jgi:hypothetical protein
MGRKNKQHENEKFQLNTDHIIYRANLFEYL